MNIRINALAIILRNNKILVVPGFDKVKNKKFYRLLGGGVEFGETSQQALIREFKEELGVTVTNMALKDVVENIFEFNGVPGHEITFLYTADIVEQEVYNVKEIKILDSEDNKMAEWVSLEQIKLNSEIVYPEHTMSFLK